MYYRKAIVAIADGLGDRPHPLLNGLTPLQKAHTPNLDRVASQGICGMMDLIAPGIPVGTDMGHLVLFGGRPDDYPGRGPIEAYGIEMDTRPGDVIFRCNLATVDEYGIVIDRRAGRINQNTVELVAAVNGMVLSDNVTAYMQAATEHRAVLVFRGANLSENITDSDPKAPHDGKPYVVPQASDNSEKSLQMADLMQLFLNKSHAILDAHPINTERKRYGLLPANFILTRGPGRCQPLASVPQKYGFNGCCIAGETTVLGVAKLLGYSTHSHPLFTANISSNFQLKAERALLALDNNDLVFVHFKATDLAGHDNLPFEKITAIEHFDRMVGLILDNLPEYTYLALAADHSTPCEVKEHTGEPVPVALCGNGIRQDNVMQFDEYACAKGGLNRLSGTDFIHTVIDYMGYSQKQGS